MPRRQWKVLVNAAVDERSPAVTVLQAAVVVAAAAAPRQWHLCDCRVWAFLSEVWVGFAAWFRSLLTMKAATWELSWSDDDVAVAPVGTAQP
jgi:hypothetical protein